MYRVIGVLLATLTALSAQASIDKTKPLLAVVLAHGDPDHYGGVTNLIAGNDIPVTDCFALLAPLGAHPVASDPAANEQGLKFPRVQGALR
jgi:alkyl sulfatase BDS1-like metallo-beta-lactamase superfamily hydrolase